MRYRAEIDGLRALAVIPVILFHAGFELFGGGYVGVDVFFVVSGYLITTIIVNDLDANKFSIVKFYKRRARRILPALIFVILTCIPLAWWLLLPREMTDFSQSLVAVSTFSSNFFFWLESDYFAAAAELKPLLHTWSLAVEEQYYVIFPLLLLLLWRTGSVWTIAFLSCLLLASFVTAHVGAYSDPVATFYLLSSRGWELLVGVMVAFYLRHYQIETSKRIAEFGGALGLSMVLLSVVLFGNETPFPSAYALLPTIGTALVILFAIDGTVVQRVLSAKVLVGIGLISYSAYLWHQPLLAFAKYRSPFEPPAYLIGAICILTFPIAYLSWRFIECPFRQNDRIPTSRFVTGCIVITLALLLIGILGHFNRGFPARISGRYDGIVNDVALQISSSFTYVDKRWRNELALRNFDDDPATLDVLVIGDSYAMDVSNAIFESGLSDTYFLSAYNIPRICGNLWTDKDLSIHIKRSNRARCEKHKRYSEPKAAKLMSDADEIWLISSWQEWQLPYLPETIERIQKYSRATLRIFGRKNFGSNISFYNYLHVTDAGKRAYIVDLTEEHIRTNDMMRSLVSEDLFIDVSTILCGRAHTCSNTTADGMLISYDGNHLTKAGAIFLGERIKHVLLPLRFSPFSLEWKELH